MLRKGPRSLTTVLQVDILYIILDRRVSQERAKEVHFEVGFNIRLRIHWIKQRIK